MTYVGCTSRLRGTRVVPVTVVASHQIDAVARGVQRFFAAVAVGCSQSLEAAEQPVHVAEHDLVRAADGARHQHVVVPAAVHVHVTPLARQPLARLQHGAVDADGARPAGHGPRAEADAQRSHERAVPTVRVHFRVHGPLAAAQPQPDAVRAARRRHAHLVNAVVAPVLLVPREEIAIAAARVAVHPEVEPASVELRVAAVAHPHPDHRVAAVHRSQVGQAVVHQRPERGHRPPGLVRRRRVSGPDRGRRSEHHHQQRRHDVQHSYLVVYIIGPSTTAVKSSCAIGGPGRRGVERTVTVLLVTAYYSCARPLTGVQSTACAWSYRKKSRGHTCCANAPKDV